MPQDKNKKSYMTRDQAGIYNPMIVRQQPLRPNPRIRGYGGDLTHGAEDRTIAGMSIRDGVKYNQDTIKMLEGDYFGNVLPKRTARELAAHATDQKVVSGRDAYNAKIMRGKLADRASAAAEAAGVRAKRGAAMRRGAMAGLGTAALAVANDARRMPTSEEDTNDSYGMTALGGTQGTYPNQGRMSKALGVKNTKAGM
jgi:hypothetical protein